MCWPGAGGGKWTGTLGLVTPGHGTGGSPAEGRGALILIITRNDAGVSQLIFETRLAVDR